MGIRVLTLFSALLLFSCSEAEETVAVESDDYLSGTDFYMQRCVPCHGEDGSAGVGGAKDLATSTHSAELIEKVIREGQNGMAPFIHHIEDERTLGELVDFVNELKK